MSVIVTGLGRRNNKGISDSIAETVPREGWTTHDYQGMVDRVIAAINIMNYNLRCCAARLYNYIVTLAGKRNNVWTTLCI